MFKIEVKKKYIINGKEYSSLEESRLENQEFKKYVESYNPVELEQKKRNFSMIPIYNVNVSNLIFCPQLFKDVNLGDIIDIRKQLSNDQYAFVLPTYSEIKKMEEFNLFPSRIQDKEYWTSTRFLYNTYISYDYSRKTFNDIYPQYRRDAFLLIKENKPESWLRDPPIPGSIDEILFLQENK
jgi:hypothetical protein